MRPMRYAHVLICALLPLSACNCEDATEGEPWELSEPFPEDLGVDDEPDMAIVEEDMPPPEPDMTEIPEELPWEREVIVEVPRSQALNDRTSMDVATDNTIWIGYHPCRDSACDEPQLGTVSSKPGEQWRLEEITEQRGVFGLIVNGDEPWVAYLDEVNSQFRVAHRDLGDDLRGPEAWNPEALPVNYSGRFDGLDLTHDERFTYVTFASDRAEPVDLFALDMEDRSRGWIELSKLDVNDASAALERGLAADGQGNLFLVHRDGFSGPYGVARYNLRDNIWDRQSYFDTTNVVVSSMVARENGDICMSSTVNLGGLNDGYLEVTCGRINNLRRDVWRFEDESVSSYSSLIEGRDGSLIIAFNGGGNTELRVARRYPDGTWDFRQVYDGPSFGVSTAIDKENKLLISYYTERDGRYTLELLRQPY